MRLLVSHNVGHQLGIRRHLSRGHSGRPLSKKLVMPGRVEDAESDIWTTTLVKVNGRIGLIEQSASR